MRAYYCIRLIEDGTLLERTPSRRYFRLSAKWWLGLLGTHAVYFCVEAEWSAAERRLRTYALLEG